MSRSKLQMSVYGLPLLLAVVGTACSSDSTGPAGVLSDCTGDVSVSVSGGTAPAFSWTPACRAFFVLVEPANSGADVWSIITDSTNAIAPPVTYGVAPAGALQLDLPTPLVTGQAYNVYVFRWTGPGKQDGVLSGTGTFTP